jgi:hypothetical protein
MLGFRHSRDASPGIFRRDEVATAQQRDRLVKGSFPAALRQRCFSTDTLGPIRLGRNWRACWERSQNGPSAAKGWVFPLRDLYVRCRTLALFGSAVMSDLSPKCAPKRTSADHSEFMGSRPSQLTPPAAAADWASRRRPRPGRRIPAPADRGRQIRNTSNCIPSPRRTARPSGCRRTRSRC